MKRAENKESIVILQQFQKSLFSSGHSSSFTPLFQKMVHSNAIIFMPKREITPSFEPLERKLEAVKKTLTQLDKCSTDLADQQAAIEANIHDNIGQLHEVLEVRRIELIGQ